jgi:hypothetical protein
MVQYLALRLLRRAFESGNIQFLLGGPGRVNPCIVHMNQNEGLASFLEFGCIFSASGFNTFFPKEW